MTEAQAVTPGSNSPISVSFKGLAPASPRSSAAARGSSRKKDTHCELILRKALWAAGFRYLKNLGDLPGRPDIVFRRQRVAIFCDGDFWHGNNWETRKERLRTGANSEYWLAKIERNMTRDRETDLRLEVMGWKVVRIWESQILADSKEIVDMIRLVLASP